MLNAAFQLLFAAAMLCLRGAELPGWLNGALLLISAVNLGSIPFCCAVLRQRLREIDRGELDEARKY